MRTMIVYGNNKQIKYVQSLLEPSDEEFTKRHVQINYKNFRAFRAELYGHDGNLVDVVYTPEQIISFLEKIDSMPMGSIEKQLREGFLGLKSENAFEMRFDKSLFTKN